MRISFQIFSFVNRYFSMTSIMPKYPYIRYHTFKLNFCSSCYLYSVFPWSVHIFRPVRHTKYCYQSRPTYVRCFRGWLMMHKILFARSSQHPSRLDMIWYLGLWKACTWKPTVVTVLPCLWPNKAQTGSWLEMRVVRRGINVETLRTEKSISINLFSKILDILKVKDNKLLSLTAYYLSMCILNMLVAYQKKIPNSKKTLKGTINLYIEKINVQIR